jgi:rhodanese-related sulfurtransferase
VLGVLPGIVGTLQANEVLKLLLGAGTPAIGKLTTFDAMDFEFKTFKIRRDPACPVCGEHPTITEPIDYEQFCGVPALDPKSLAETEAEVKRAKGGAAPDPSLDSRGLPPGYNFDATWEITPREVKSLLDKREKFVFIDCRLPNEYAITNIPGAALLPLQQLPVKFGEIKGHANEKVIVHCRSGGRSMQFAKMLKQQGFKDVKSMAGGILLWNKDINPGGPQY